MNHVSRLSAVRVGSIPEMLDRKLFLESVIGKQMLTYHDFGTSETILISEDTDRILNSERVFPGTELIQTKAYPATLNEMRCIIVLAGMESADFIDKAYALFAGNPFGLFVSFVKMDKDHVAIARMRAAEEISSKEVGMTRSSGTRTGDYSETATKHMELFHESDEKKALLGLLDSLDRAMLANGTAYKVMLLLDAGSEQLYEHIKSKLPIIEERRLKVTGIEDLYASARRLDAMPFDSLSASCMLGFAGSVRRSRIIATPR